jgi:hypothetical protein
MKIEIKDSWEQINLRTFLEINALNEDVKFKDTVVARRVKLISLISNMSYDELLTTDSDSLQKLMEATKFLDVLPEEANEKEFDVNGVKHMIIKDFNKMTAGESISLEQVLLNKDELGDFIVSDILSILIRPSKNGVIDKFDEMLLEDRKELFMEYLTVPYFMGFLTALLTGETSLESLIQRFSGVQKSTIEKVKK